MLAFHVQKHESLRFGPFFKTSFRTGRRERRRLVTQVHDHGGKDRKRATARDRSGLDNESDKKTKKVRHLRRTVSTERGKDTIRCNAKRHNSTRLSLAFETEIPVRHPDVSHTQK